MSGECNAVEKFVEEMLIDLMAENCDREMEQASRRLRKCEAHPINLARLYPASGWCS
jgi:hypothetical protein